jgi:SHS2 domain-containing protein
VVLDCRSLRQLLYNFLEEVLYLFVAEPYLAINRIAITELVQEGPALGLVATCFGEEYVRAKHGSRTEIKAVTCSNLQVERKVDGSVEAYVIFDI